MKFTKTPLNYGSIHDELIYSFATETPQTVTVKIINQNSFKTVATKRFVGVTSADIDVAPYLRAETKYVPKGGPTGFYVPTFRAFAVVVEINGVESEPRMYTDTECSVDNPFLSTMPLSRAITDGESDHMLIRPQNPITVTVIAQMENGLTVAESYQQKIGGLMMFRLNTQDFAGATQITVSLGEIADVVYSIISQPKSARRLAWVSSKGSIEHYTFPIEKQVDLEVNRRSIRAENGMRRNYAITKSSSTTLLSAYEPTKVIGALSEILYSNYTWEVNGSEYVSVDVMESKSSIKLHGMLSNVVVVLSSNEQIKL